MSHRYSSKATPPVETPPINPLVQPKYPPTSVPADLAASSPTPANNIPSSPSPYNSSLFGNKKPSRGSFTNNNDSLNGRDGVAPLALTNENATDLHLLSPAEQHLCSTLRILPKPYLVMKEVLMKEAMKHGGVLKKKVAREICRVSLLFPFHHFYNRLECYGVGINVEANGAGHRLT